MLYVDLFRSDRARDLEFWALLWQVGGPPADFSLIAAYNLLSDLRVIVFTAETVQSIRWLDRLNMVGKLECFPALDQTAGYQAAAGRDLDRFAGFMRARGASETAIAREVQFRGTAMNSPSAWAALAWAHEWKERQRPSGSDT